MIKAIIFDFAGVITTEGYWNWLFANIPNLEDKKQYFLNFSKGVDKNETSEDKFLSMLSAKSGKEKNIIKQEIFAEYTLNKDVVVLIEFLRKYYKIALLSNFVIGWLPKLLKLLKIEYLFDKIIISSDYYMVKPKPEIYKKALELLNILPDEAIFIDDRMENVIGAKNIEMHAFKYSNFKELIFNLQSLGVKTSE